VGGSRREGDVAEGHTGMRHFHELFDGSAFICVNEFTETITLIGR